MVNSGRVEFIGKVNGHIHRDTCLRSYAHEIDMHDVIFDRMGLHFTRQSFLRLAVNVELAASRALPLSRGKGAVVSEQQKPT